MNILVINCGSSSLKFQVIDTASETMLAKGLCERIGIDGSLTYENTVKKSGKITREVEIPNHKVGIQLVLNELTDPENGVISSLEEIGAVGHRVVHGGEKFAKPVIINDEVIEAIRECSDLAPLHNPANLTGIEACRSVMPGTPMVAVFDTAFHQTMPSKAYMYAIPLRYYENYKIRKYGFHGTSHDFVSSDFRDLWKGEEEGNKNARLALEAFAYSVAKYIGAYAAAMNGVDVICFTAGVGENDAQVRAMIGEYLGYLGTAIDPEANKVHGELREISTKDSKVKMFVLPTNEELAIARQTLSLVEQA